MNKLDNIYSRNSSIEDYIKRYSSYITELLGRLDYSAIGGLIDLLQNARNNGRKILFIGNGGSAATCSHFVEDLAAATMHTEKNQFNRIHHQPPVRIRYYSNRFVLIIFLFFRSLPRICLQLDFSFSKAILGPKSCDKTINWFFQKLKATILQAATRFLLWNGSERVY